MLRCVDQRRVPCTELFVKCSVKEKICSKMFSLNLSSGCSGGVGRDEVYIFCRGSRGKRYVSPGCESCVRRLLTRLCLT